MDLLHLVGSEGRYHPSIHMVNRAASYFLWYFFSGFFDEWKDKKTCIYLKLKCFVTKYYTVQKSVICFYFFKGVLLCSFTKSWFSFGGVLDHALMLGGSKIALFFTLFTLLQYLSPQPDTNDSISSGFDEGPPSKKRNVFWLVSCHSALWLENS